MRPWEGAGIKKMRKVDKIVIHCSDSLFGDVKQIRKWHKERGWDDIGYHYVIGNAYPTSNSYKFQLPEFWNDGKIEEGRAIEIAGAHARGFNRTSIGICLIGKRCFSFQQFESLKTKLDELSESFPEIQLYGHYELNTLKGKSKTCPNIDMNWLRDLCLF